jgi:hypothetical protein
VFQSSGPDERSSSPRPSCIRQATLADWGCRDGNHQAWLIVEVGGKDEARQIVPPAFRDEAKVTALNNFTVEEIDTILSEHQP